MARRAALESELSRCVAELRMLGAEKGKEGRDFKTVLADVTAELGNLKDNVAGAMLTVFATLLHYIIKNANESIQSLDISIAASWSDLMTTVSSVRRDLSAVQSLSGLVHENLPRIVESIHKGLDASGMEFNNGDSSAGAKNTIMLTILGNVGSNLNELNTGGTYFNFLGDDAKPNMMSIISILNGELDP